MTRIEWTDIVLHHFRLEKLQDRHTESRSSEPALSRGTTVALQTSPISDDTAACSQVPYLNI